MKKIITKTLALGSIALLMLASCKKDGALVVSNGGKAGTLSANVSTLVLDKTKLADTTAVVTFSFTKANFGYEAAITNTLQIDVPSDNWKTPTSVVMSTGASATGYSTSVFNALLLKLNLAAGAASQVNVRIMHSVGQYTTPVYSNVLTLTVTPFNLTSWVYVVGAYQGWSLTAADSLISVTGNGIYTGIVNFTAGNNQFLILPQKSSYDNKYATSDAGATNTTVTVGGSNNLFAPTAAGQYLVTLNTNNSTISIVPADYYSVIGDAAQGWSTDVAMKYTNDLAQDWVVTLPLVSTGSFKIRQDDAWSFSWGTLATPDGKTLTDASGGNIAVAASGNYTVTFDMAPTAFGATPAVTTAYSVK